jgi:hypothetical protein
MNFPSASTSASFVFMFSVCIVYCLFVYYSPKALINPIAAHVTQRTPKGIAQSVPAYIAHPTASAVAIMIRRFASM